jgi:hypothetical protein
VNQTVEEAQALIDAKKQENISKCEKEIVKALEKYACSLSWSLTLTNSGQVIPDLKVINKE